MLTENLAIQLKCTARNEIFVEDEDGNCENLNVVVY